MFFSFLYFLNSGTNPLFIFRYAESRVVGFSFCNLCLFTRLFSVCIVKYFFFFLSTKPTSKSCLIQDSSNPFCICFCLNYKSGIIPHFFFFLSLSLSLILNNFFFFFFVFVFVLLGHFYKEILFRVV
jgi:hypothetical protein